MPTSFPPNGFPLTRELVVQTEDGKATERVPSTEVVRLTTPIGIREFAMVSAGRPDKSTNHEWGRVVDVATGARIWTASEVEYFPVHTYPLAELVRIRISGRDVEAWKARIFIAERTIEENGLDGFGLVPIEKPPEASEISLLDLDVDARTSPSPGEGGAVARRALRMIMSQQESELGMLLASFGNAGGVLVTLNANGTVDNVITAGEGEGRRATVEYLALEFTLRADEPVCRICGCLADGRVRGRMRLGAPRRVHPLLREGRAAIVSELRISDELSLPLSVVTQTSAVLGVRGTGKTNTGTVLVEEAYEHGTQFVVVDPLAVWWGLRTSADGEDEAIPCVVFGGDRGDLPLTEELAERIADLVVDTGISAVLSLAELSRAGQARFVATFLERIYRRKAEPGKGTRLLVAIDEASAFVPQRFGAEMAKCVGAVEQLVRRGRSRGLGCILIDQRAASVNKDVLTQLDLLIAHRLTSPQDRGAILDWVKGSDDPERAKELDQTLASIGRKDAIGEAWVWSPLLEIFTRVRIRPRSTFDSSRTPGAGEIPIVPTKAARPDLDALREALASKDDSQPREDPSPPLASEHGNEDDRAEIERLKAVLLKVTEERNDLSYRDEVVARDRRLLERKLAESAAQLRAAAESIEKLIGAPDPKPVPPPLFSGSPTTVVRHKPEVAKPLTQNTASGKSETLGSVGSDLQLLILRTVKMFAAIGVEKPTIAHVAAVLGKSHTSGHFRGVLKTLREQRWVTFEGGLITLAGGDPPPVRPLSRPSLDDVHQIWIHRQAELPGQVLRLAIDARPGGIAIASVGEKLDKSTTSGYFRGVLKTLRSQGLVTVEDGVIRATPFLFPPGLQ